MDELQRLSPRGRVAYAVRAALRVEPLYPESLRGHESVCKANRIAQAWVEGLNVAMSDARAAAYAADAAAADAAATRAARAATRAAHAATHAAYAAAYAIATDVDADVDAAVDAAASAASAANDATVLAQCCHDYARLLDVAPLSAAKKDDPAGPPFLLAELGQLWPDGVPDWYSKRVPDVGPEAPPLDSSVDSIVVPGIVTAWDPEVLPAGDFNQLVAMIGDLVRAEGGDGLTLMQTLGFTVERERVTP
jgi:hypothetical protein